MASSSKNRSLREYPARNIAIIKPSALGDIVHSLPVLSAVRRRHPDARITCQRTADFALLGT